jgi:hypothetical protein
LYTVDNPGSCFVDLSGEGVLDGSSHEEFRILHPRRTGPIEIDPHWRRQDPNMPPRVNNLQTLWECCQVYCSDLCMHDGEPTQLLEKPIDMHCWLERRDQLLKAASGCTPPYVNETTEDAPLFYLARGRRMPPAEARRRVFWPVYAKLLRRTRAFTMLCEEIKHGSGNVVIICDHADDAINNKECAFARLNSNDASHAATLYAPLMLMCMLNNWNPWQQ